MSFLVSILLGDSSTKKKNCKKIQKNTKHRLSLFSPPSPSPPTAEATSPSTSPQTSPPVNSSPSSPLSSPPLPPPPPPVPVPPPPPSSFMTRSPPIQPPPPPPPPPILFLSSFPFLFDGEGEGEASGKAGGGKRALVERGGLGGFLTGVMNLKEGKSGGKPVVKSGGYPEGNVTDEGLLSSISSNIFPKITFFYCCFSYCSSRFSFSSRI